MEGGEAGWIVWVWGVGLGVGEIWGKGVGEGGDSDCMVVHVRLEPFRCLGMR